MQSFKGQIHTIVTGKAMSAGALLLLSGTNGRRFAYKYSRIMLHELSTNLHYDKLHQLETQLQDGQDLQNILNDIIVKHTKISKKKIKEMLKVDTYLSPKQALSLGIIDKVI